MGGDVPPAMLLEVKSMVRTMRVTIVAVMALVALARPGVAAAQGAQPVTLESFAGAWEGSAQTPNDDSPSRIRASRRLASMASLTP